MPLGAHTESTGHTGSVFGVSVSAAAPHLVATASDDETVRLWEDAEHAGAWRTTCSAPVADSAMCLNFSPDAALLAAGTADGIAHLYDVRRGSRAGEPTSLEAGACLRDHPEEVYACEFLEAREGALCTASGDSLFQWDLAAAALVQESGPPAVPGDKRAAAMPARWQPGYVFALRQQPGGGGLLAGACSDGAVRIWAAGPALQPLWGRRLHGAIAAGCAFTADGAALVSLSKAGEIVVLDIRQRAELARGMAPVALHGCCLLPDGGVAVCGAEGTVMIIDPTDLDGGLRVMSRHQTERREALYCIATSAEGAPLVAGGAALMQPVAAAGAVEEGTDGDDGSDPLFDAGETLVNSSGARVVFTTAAASKLEPTAAKGAAVHVWETT